MTKVVACIIARTTSTRLPHKVLRNVIEEMTLLDVLIKRVQKCRGIDDIYIATSNEKVDDILEDYSAKHGIKIYRGSVENVISRMNEIGKIESATHLIRITGDNIFTDPNLLEYQISKHIQSEWEYSRFENVPIGLTAEVINADTLLDCECRINPNESEYMMLYLFNPNIYETGVIIFDSKLPLNNYTLTVDTYDDLYRTREILSHLSNIYCDLKEILNVIKFNKIENVKYQNNGIVKLPNNEQTSFEEFRKDMDNRIEKSQVLNYQTSSYFLYAETAFHHEGDINELYKLINLAKEGNFAGVKFQVLFKLEDYMIETHSNFESIANLLFSEDKWKEVIGYTKSLGLEVIFMPLDTSAMKWAINNKALVDYIDIHSVSFYDQELMNIIKQSKMPIILGIGGRELNEIESAIKYFGDKLKVLMHGFQSFPTDIEKSRLMRIKVLVEKYPDVKIGYADHSPYYTEDAVEALIYAYILGARVFEKHITLSEGIEKTDYSAAVGIDKMKKIKNRLNSIETIINDEKLFILNDDENIYRERQKKLVASQKIKKGELITSENTALKIIENEEGNIYLNKYPTLETYAAIDLEINQPIKICNLDKGNQLSRIYK